jgi:hypothetical protein
MIKLILKEISKRNEERTSRISRITAGYGKNKTIDNGDEKDIKNKIVNIEKLIKKEEAVDDEDIISILTKDENKDKYSHLIEILTNENYRIHFDKCNPLGGTQEDLKKKIKSDIEKKEEEDKENTNIKKSKLRDTKIMRDIKKELLTKEENKEIEEESKEKEEESKEKEAYIIEAQLKKIIKKLEDEESNLKKIQQKIKDTKKNNTKEENEEQIKNQKEKIKEANQKIGKYKKILLLGDRNEKKQIEDFFPSEMKKINKKMEKMEKISKSMQERIKDVEKYARVTQEREEGFMGKIKTGVEYMKYANENKYLTAKRIGVKAGVKTGKGILGGLKMTTKAGYTAMGGLTLGVLKTPGLILDVTNKMNDGINSAANRLMDNVGLNQNNYR